MVSARTRASSSLLVVVVLCWVGAPTRLFAQAAPRSEPAERLSAPTSHPFVFVGPGPLVVADTTPPAFPDEDDELYVTLRAHPSVHWIWLGRVERGADICWGECTLRLAPGSYRLGLSRAGQDVVALPVQRFDSSGVLTGRYLAPTGVSVGGVILTGLGGLALLGGLIAVVPGVLHYREDRYMAAGFSLAGLIVAIIGLRRLLRAPIRERHHYTPWVTSHATSARMH